MDVQNRQAFGALPLAFGALPLSAPIVFFYQLGGYEASWMTTTRPTTLLADELGGVSVHVLDAACEPFPGTVTTAAITLFRPRQRQPRIAFDMVADVGALGDVTSGRPVAVDALLKADRWDPSGDVGRGRKPSNSRR
jgi:hypothetical protein